MGKYIQYCFRCVHRQTRLDMPVPPQCGLCESQYGDTPSHFKMQETHAYASADAVPKRHRCPRCGEEFDE